MEIWKDIKNYENLYQVSNFGNIKSVDKFDCIGRNIKGKLLKQRLRKDGYLDINLTKNKKSKKYLIHTLVANCFLENKNNYKEINHKDENKTNNNVSNLEWCCRSYNINYGKANKKRHTKLLNKRGKKVVQLDLQNNVIQIYNSLREANRKTKINIAHLCECCQNKRITAGNYKWQYKII